MRIVCTFYLTACLTIPPFTPPSLSPAELSEVNSSSVMPLDNNALKIKRKQIILLLFISTRKMTNELVRHFYLFYESHVLCIFSIGTIFILHLNSNNWATIGVLCIINQKTEITGTIFLFYFVGCV